MLVVAGAATVAEAIPQALAQNQAQLTFEATQRGMEPMLPHTKGHKQTITLIITGQLKATPTRIQAKMELK